MEGTRGRKSLMESRSRVVTGNSNIFCVAKLDWQFIGNIRLRGVTPSFRVPCNQQKSPPPLSISLSLYLSISNPCCPPHVVGCKFARSLERLIPEQEGEGNDSIPVAAVNAPSPQWHCSLDRCNCCFEAAFASPSFFSPLPRVAPLTIFEFYSLNSQLLPFPIRFDDFFESSSSRKFILWTFFFFSSLFWGLEENVIVLYVEKMMDRILEYWIEFWNLFFKKVRDKFLVYKIFFGILVYMKYEKVGSLSFVVVFSSLSLLSTKQAAK